MSFFEEVVKNTARFHDLPLRRLPLVPDAGKTGGCPIFKTDIEWGAFLPSSPCHSKNPELGMMQRW